MNEQGNQPEGTKRGPNHQLVAVLWGIAAALAVIAVVLDTMQTGRVRATRLIMAGLFALVAFASYRRARKLRGGPTPPAS